jgi:tetratricopeptide (TPR) repeat protein
MLAQITDALRRGDAATALSTARSFAAAEPTNPAAQHLLGVALLQNGDRAGARAAFEAALAVAPDRAEVYFSLANLHLAEGDSAAAVRRLHEALSLDPNQLGAYVLLLHLALARGDQDEAARQLKLAQRVDAEHPQVRVAEGYLAQARGDADTALKCFTAAATAAPTLAAAQLALGNAYLGRGMWPFAEQALANALALDGSRASTTLRALAEARRRQGKAKETLEILDELIAREPGDLGARSVRAEILSAEGELEAALGDQLQLLAQHPDHPRTVLLASAQLARTGRAENAVQVVEVALAKSPTIDELWRARLNVSGMIGEDPKPILDRWLDANPGSVNVLDVLAGYHQANGDAALAESYADRALAQNPALQASVSIKLDSELRDDPPAALARIEALLPGVSDPLQRRTLLGWAGTVLDAMDRHAEAGARWNEMIRVPVPGQLPPPGPLPADTAPAGEGTGTLLWSPPGLRSEFVLRQLKEQLGPRLRLDRLNNPAAAGDGFGLLRFSPGHPEAGTAQRWRESLQSVGLDPATTVDWLPFVDGYTLQALQGARVIALLGDPRDLLLNWMVHGSVQGFMFSNEAVRSAQWLAATLEAIADYREAHPGRVHLVRLDRDAGKAATQLETLLELPQTLPALFGPGVRFPVGHWKKYRTTFAEAFAVLEPVAARLGYPAD